MSDLYLDHILIGVRDLARTPQTFGNSIGLTVTPEGIHPGRGSHNRLIVFGPEYLELISIHDRIGPVFRPNLIPFLDSREGLFIFALGTHGIESGVEELRAHGLEVEDPIAGARHAEDGTTAYSWLQAAIDKAGTPGSQTFLMQHNDPFEERFREPAEPAEHANGALGVHHLGLAVRDAETAASQWERAFGLSRRESDRRGDVGLRRTSLALGNCTLDFLSPSEGGVLAEFLDRYGEAPYELALDVRDISVAKDYLQEHGVTTSGTPDGSLVVDPAYVHGVRLVLLADGEERSGARRNP